MVAMDGLNMEKLGSYFQPFSFSGFFYYLFAREAVTRSWTQAFKEVARIAQEEQPQFSWKILKGH